MNEFDTLLKIAARKATIDANSDWYQGPETYLSGIESELNEVRAELNKHRRVYVEDELADVLWDYVNVLQALAKEQGIDPQRVLARACQKYQERVTAIEQDQSWDEVKRRQSVELAKAHCQDVLTPQDK
ncbi:MazG nucleotide pyrophosphohydrolase domain-containing protein [Vibrio porteresiae]|uniref:MazG nucleotide pyrophosphohydrolase domain-containing protein n=1 Tax=Vibrio porteresiae DSM 19223 TaxID=1123496 RepID=A0ABZ0QIF8_9VIBR|nr:MazG nucleotide pyrophosphohydrolase domain-containing protein [Vibrio porteresiae]WPC75831.1 MazG nucleotide pyrophosphohydrolase domain-containing protein [Vibrio porteresiae DSM 19223]